MIRTPKRTQQLLLCQDRLQLRLDRLDGYYGLIHERMDPALLAHAKRLTHLHTHIENSLEITARKNRERKFVPPPPRKAWKTAT